MRSKIPDLQQNESRNPSIFEGVCKKKQHFQEFLFPDATICRHEATELSVEVYSRSILCSHSSTLIKLEFQRKFEHSLIKMGQTQSKGRLIDTDLTCAEVLHAFSGKQHMGKVSAGDAFRDKSVGSLITTCKIGGFCGYNFVIDNHQPISALYATKDKLGQGSYACVYRAFNKSTEKQHAIKVINKRNCRDINRVLLEIAAMKTLDHPNILRIFETFEDDNNIYLVLEMCLGSDLYDSLIARKKFNELQAATVMEQVFRAFTYMWERNFVHRDLKPENIMFFETWQTPPEKSTVKLMDFGFARIGKEDELMHTKSGTCFLSCLLHFDRHL